VLIDANWVSIVWIWGIWHTPNPMVLGIQFTNYLVANSDEFLVFMSWFRQLIRFILNCWWYIIYPFIDHIHWWQLMWMLRDCWCLSHPSSSLQRSMDGCWATASADFTLKRWVLLSLGSELAFKFTQLDKCWLYTYDVWLPNKHWSSSKCIGST
jgi:hypothetical protein